MNETLTTPFVEVEAPDQQSIDQRAFIDAAMTRPDTVKVKIRGEDGDEWRTISADEYVAAQHAQEQRQKIGVIVIGQDGVPKTIGGEQLKPTSFDQQKTDAEFNRIMSNNFARDHFGANAFEGVDLVPHEETVAEKTGHFWKKHKQALLEKFSPAYWGARWTIALNDFANRGITEDMSERRQQMQAEKNRRNEMLGFIGLTAGAVALLVGEVASVLDTVQHIEARPLLDAATSLNHAGNFHGPIDPNAAPHAQYLHVPESASVQTPVEQPVHTVSNEPAWSQITPNEGGEKLFANAGLTDAQWHEHANELLKLTHDFYRMEDGTIGIRRVGRLSQAAQDLITNIQSQ